MHTINKKNINILKTNSALAGQQHKIQAATLQCFGSRPVNLPESTHINPDLYFCIKAKVRVAGSPPPQKCNYASQQGRPLQLRWVGLLAG